MLLTLLLEWRTILWTLLLSGFPLPLKSVVLGVLCFLFQLGGLWHAQSRNTCNFTALQFLYGSSSCWCIIQKFSTCTPLYQPIPYFITFLPFCMYSISQRYQNQDQRSLIVRTLSQKLRPQADQKGRFYFMCNWFQCLALLHTLNCQRLTLILFFRK